MFASREYCRSPVAQGVFESVARREGPTDDIEADTAGTDGFYHAGGSPDPLAQESVLARGTVMSHGWARLLEQENRGRLDFVLTMDEQNYGAAADLCRGGPAGFRRTGSHRAGV